LSFNLGDSATICSNTGEKHVVKIVWKGIVSADIHQQRPFMYGIVYKSPIGKHSGRNLFHCKKNCGSLVLPKRLIKIQPRGKSRIPSIVCNDNHVDSTSFARNNSTCQKETKLQCSSSTVSSNSKSSITIATQTHEDSMLSPANNEDDTSNTSSSKVELPITPRNFENADYACTLKPSSCVTPEDICRTPTLKPLAPRKPRLADASRTPHRKNPTAQSINRPISNLVSTSNFNSISKGTNSKTSNGEIRCFGNFTKNRQSSGIKKIVANHNVVLKCPVENQDHQISNMKPEKTVENIVKEPLNRKKVDAKSGKNGNIVQIRGLSEKCRFTSEHNEGEKKNGVKGIRRNRRSISVPTITNKVPSRLSIISNKQIPKHPLMPLKNPKSSNVDNKKYCTPKNSDFKENSKIDLSNIENIQSTVCTRNFTDLSNNRKFQELNKGYTKSIPSSLNKVHKIYDPKLFTKDLKYKKSDGSIPIRRNTPLKKLFCDR